MEELASIFYEVEVGKQVKEEVKHGSQGFGLLTWMNHDAIYQEEKDMGGGRQEFHVNVFSFRFL